MSTIESISHHHHHHYAVSRRSADKVTAIALGAIGIFASFVLLPFPFNFLSSIIITKIVCNYIHLHRHIIRTSSVISNPSTEVVAIEREPDIIYNSSPRVLVVEREPDIIYNPSPSVVVVEKTPWHKRLFNRSTARPTHNDRIPVREDTSSCSVPYSAPSHRNTDSSTPRQEYDMFSPAPQTASRSSSQPPLPSSIKIDDDTIRPVMQRPSGNGRIPTRR